jgi:hypothetical protein
MAHRAGLCHGEGSMASALFRYRVSLLLFIIGLIISGVTAFPLLHELRLLCQWLGIEDPSRYAELTGLRHWIGFVAHGLEETYAKFPFIAYGTDWLAFGHLSIAVFFIRPLWKPLESDWVLKCGLICCAGILPLAFIAGALRGIPLYWQLIDSSFGVFGAVPLLYCLKLSKEMQARQT